MCYHYYFWSKVYNSLKISTHQFSLYVTKCDVHYIILQGIKVQVSCQRINVNWCDPSPINFLISFSESKIPSILTVCLMFKTWARVGTVIKLAVLVMHRRRGRHHFSTHLRGKIHFKNTAQTIQLCMRFLALEVNTK